MSQIPESFRATLVARVSNDDILTVKGCHRGRCYTTSIDLKPIVAQVADMIRKYHTCVLHGDMERETVAGLGDWFRSATQSATAIANAKAAKKLWSTVEKHHGKIEQGLGVLGPYGRAASIGMKTGFTVKSMLTKAKAGDPTALNDVKKIVDLSRQGDPSAVQATKMMRTMNEMGKRKDAKAAEEVSGFGFYELGLAS